MEELIISIGGVDGAAGGVSGVVQNESSFYLLSLWRGILVKNAVFSKKVTQKIFLLEDNSTCNLFE